jgi:trehalose 6-phosphate phosphatase
MTVRHLTRAVTAPPPLELQSAALFLDLDGTLAPIAERPQDVSPDPRRTSLVARLQAATAGRLAVISGRTLEDVDRILESRVRRVAAIHGLVRRPAAGEPEQAAPHPGLAVATDTFRTFAEADDGLLVEPKGLSVALHYRLAPAFERQAREIAELLAQETGLVLQAGRMVVELRTPGPDKGDSVRAFMGDPAFAGARPVFIGDDVTDEAGFAAAAELGGFGVLVGPERETRARHRLADVDAALAWLEAAL